MRQNPHVRICGGPGSATTLVYPTAAGRGRRGPDTARLCAAARAQATRPDRPAIVAHAATGWADAAEHTHAPARASGAGDGFATRSRQVRAPHHLIRVPIETPACRCWE